MKTILAIILVPLCFLGMNMLAFLLSFPMSVKLGLHHADRITRRPRFTLRAFLSRKT